VVGEEEMVVVVVGSIFWACWMLRTTLFGASAIVCKYGSFQITLKATIQSGGKTWMKIGYNFMGYQVLVPII
jgi:hypothetical protein